CEGRGRACDILSSLPALLTPGILLLFSLKELTLLSPVIYSVLLPIPPMLTYLFLRWKVRDQLLPLKLFSSFTLLSALLPYFLLPSEAWPYLPKYHPLPIIVALGGASLVAWLFILLTRHLLRKSPSHYPAPSGINAAIVFGHTLDALATAWAVDFLSYTEKHVLPRFLFQIAGTAFSIIPIKIALVVLVLYTLDVYMRVEARRNPTIFGLIKLAILILGLGPGLRDITRVAVGV
ncbi:MAG: DUF63 family protein, partial [Thermoplasmata archaeon]|nr:DUF63 family protein [Thermoplasmata archaeon]